MSKSKRIKIIDDYFSKDAIKLSDFAVRWFFNNIKLQCRKGRSDNTLLEFQHEMEYRNIKYRLK